MLKHVVHILTADLNGKGDSCLRLQCGVILKIFAKPHSETSISRRKIHCSEMTRRRGRRLYAKRASFAVALFPKLALMGLGKAFMGNRWDRILSCSVCTQGMQT